MRKFAKIGIMFVALLSASLAQGQTPATLDVELLARLQPLRVRHESLGPELLPIAKLLDRKRYPQACSQIAKLRVDLIHKAAPLFYQPTRKGGGDVEGVSHFLQTHVAGPKPTLQIIQESFVPSQAMRALAVDACVRAKQPQEAVVFVADLALMAHDAQARLALALLKAQIAGQWSAGLAALDPTVTGPRAALLRALAGHPTGAVALCAQAWREAASPDEVALVQQVAKLLAVTLPTTPAGQTP